jgi:hypothetical protein
MVIDRLVSYIVWAWALVVGVPSLAQVFLGERGAGFLGFLGLLIAFAPLGLRMWARQARKARWAGAHAGMLSEVGIAAGDYEHGEDDTGIALKLLHAGQWRTYPFSDVRGWTTSLVRPGQVGMVGGNLASSVAAMGAEARAKHDAAADTGLFVEVRDVDRPKWRIAMADGREQARWMEILRQEINERHGSAAEAGGVRA